MVKFKIWIFQYHVTDFNFLLLELVVSLKPASKLKYKDCLFAISAKLPCATTCGGFHILGPIRSVKWILAKYSARI